MPAGVAMLAAVALVLNWSGAFSGHMSFAWVEQDKVYALMAFSLSALVITTVFSEFVRGGRVLQGKLGTGLFGAMVHLTHRNTRRYGGFISHFGIALLVLS